MSEAAVLVTGGAGYIGSHVVLALRDSGMSVVVLDDLSTGVADAVPVEVPLVRGSTGDSGLVRRTLRRHGVGAVVHLAGSLVVSESVAKPLGYWRNNVANTLSLAEACVAERVTRLVFSSTAAVYGIADGAPVTEDTPCRPINPYGASKLAAERLLQDVASANDMAVVALRYFNVAGADLAGRAGPRNRNATHLIKVACEAALGRRDAVAVFGQDYDTPDGTGVRDYIHVSDLAGAHVAALRYLGEGGGSQVLNCGYGRGHSVNEVVRAVERAARRPVRLRVEGRRAGDPPSLVACNDRIRSVLQWRPEHDDLDAIVASALAWERAMDAPVDTLRHGPEPRARVARR
ncbi:UDP-glucose 4-epimerase GalE [Plastoroseomonas arctica]|uniref:UDP-glucose 4-epimerase n=1 Tax=Plastoroseomonas arctica TaxID=1509237 RepID=A0AAF1JVS9_9PROT|nr:UDP-glucose 4-epimerase GalE [Plastoroseomonas arctica]MBR0654634.1 UDP-glucose 4-epimerase GalE [Plastoroseomonas arctica]